MTNPSNMTYFKNVRLLCDFDHGGDWFVNPAETSRMMPYIRKQLADAQRCEPDSNWRLETRGTVSGAWRVMPTY